MSLKNLSSIHDLVQGPGNPVGNMLTQEGSPGYNTEEGTSNSPFEHKYEYWSLPGSYPNQDHLVALLKGKWLSKDPQTSRVGRGPPFTQQSGYMGNNPSEDLDFEGNPYGEGIFTRGHLQPKQIDGVDLHVHLLTGNYTYNHGESFALAGPSPGPTGNSDYQDFQVAPGATAADFSANFDFPGVSAYNKVPGKYNVNGPSEGFY